MSLSKKEKKRRSRASKSKKYHAVERETSRKRMAIFRARNKAQIRDSQITPVVIDDDEVSADGEGGAASPIPPHSYVVEAPPSHVLPSLAEVVRSEEGIQPVVAEAMQLYRVLPRPNVRRQAREKDQVLFDACVDRAVATATAQLYRGEPIRRRTAAPPPGVEGPVERVGDLRPRPTAGGIEGPCESEEAVEDQTVAETMQLFGEGPAERAGGPAPGGTVQLVGSSREDWERVARLVASSLARNTPPLSRSHRAPPSLTSTPLSPPSGPTGVAPAANGTSSSSPTASKRRKKKSRKRVIDESIAVEPTDGDVLFGRGGFTNTHPGNIKFRAKALALRQRYEQPTTTKEEKYRISGMLVESVRGCGHRFLERGSDGKWHEVIGNGARKKASQALRERVRGQRRPPGNQEVVEAMRPLAEEAPMEREVAEALRPPENHEVADLPPEQGEVDEAQVPQDKLLRMDVECFDVGDSGLHGLDSNSPGVEGIDEGIEEETFSAEAFLW